MPNDTVADVTPVNNDLLTLPNEVVNVTLAKIDPNNKGTLDIKMLMLHNIQNSNHPIFWEEINIISLITAYPIKSWPKNNII